MNTFDLGLTEGAEVVSLASAARELEDALLVLRLSLGRLKSALYQAFAPIGAVVVPLVSRGVNALTGLAGAVGQVTAALFGTTQATKTLTKTTRAAAAARRSLASFDTLERLGSSGSGGTVTTTQEVALPATKLSGELQAVVEGIRSLLRPLAAIDLTPAAQALSKLEEALAGLGETLTDGLSWAWYHLLVPLAAWTLEAAAPAALEALSAAFSALGQVLAPLGRVWAGFLQAMEPVFAFLGVTAVAVLEGLAGLFSQVGDTFAAQEPVLLGVLEALTGAVNSAWAGICPVLTALRDGFSALMTGLGQTVSQGIAAMTAAFQGFAQILAGLFSGDWARLWQGATQLMKNQVNVWIGVLNGALSAMVSLLNWIIRGINRIRITVPDWEAFGSLAGKSLGFSLPTVKSVSIPYLARGAVLPANRPFLAVVGDQKHGTNIEAPLSTIQEAVALVMEDYASANAAGQEATVAVLREILEAVLGIEVGDTVIGAAAGRYNAHMAIVRGGI